MLEENYRNKLHKRLEQVGGMVFRINDVAGTGIRYSDLIWIYYGNSYFIECKIAKHTLKNIYRIKQKSYATPAQTLANHLVQKAGGIYLFSLYFPEEREERLLYYKSEPVYSYREESEKVPSVVLFMDTLVEFAQVAVTHNSGGLSLREYFEKIFLDSSKNP